MKKANPFAKFAAAKGKKPAVSTTAAKPAKKGAAKGMPAFAMAKPFAKKK